MSSSSSIKNEIMLIDDDQDDCYLLQSSPLVTQLNLIFTTHSNGEEAIFDLRTRLESFTAMPKFILLDLNMPIMNGFEFLEAAKTEEQLKSIPIIVYTTSQSEADIKASYKLGANCYTVKPLDYKDTLSTFKHSCEYWLNTAQVL